MPQIERPVHRQPLRDLPLSLFIHPDYLKTDTLLGKKRPYSPSSIVSPSKRRLLAVEGVLSPRSPFKKAAADLSRALPPTTPARARNLLEEFQHPPAPRRQVPLPRLPSGFPSFESPRSRASGQGLLAPQELSPGGAQPKPRVAAEPSKAEAALLEVLKAAPKPTHMFIPGSGTARPIRRKEEDPEEDHHPGFDICEDTQSERGDVSEKPRTETNGLNGTRLESEEDEEEVAKENNPPIDVSGFWLSLDHALIRDRSEHSASPPLP